MDATFLGPVQMVEQRYDVLSHTARSMAQERNSTQMSGPKIHRINCEHTNMDPSEYHSDLHHDCRKLVPSTGEDARSAQPGATIQRMCYLDCKCTCKTTVKSSATLDVPHDKDDFLRSRAMLLIV